MKILLDECLPKKLKSLLTSFDAKTVAELKWNSLKNGDLINVAIKNEFDVFLTTDKNLEFQLNLKLYNITIVVFDVPKNKMEFLTPLIPKFIEKSENLEKRRAYRIS